MAGARPEQGQLTRDNDLSRTAETEAAIDAMVDGLNDHDIEGMGRFFDEEFRWLGNAGCGVKMGLDQFQRHWQMPFQHAFSDKVCIDEARVVQGQWCAAFGRQEAVHSGEFMGIPATGKRVEIRYMDFWKVVDGKIVDNWVMVDFPYVMQQLGVDPFGGHGWERFDSHRRALRTGERDEGEQPLAKEGDR
ncbi:ester cyclase [Halomonas sp. DP5N14-9]|uniref:ester cyclase n=1 Tax=Halomonas sp. DP5N14-9 TaxID=2859075 RepID=UPI001C996147|nr:ester cyclase [Halomonas sp. DP5N14-9]MBY5942711.1 ester cyclase [Halomonas sp. DP5N14-9]